jgi:hypothetical protein
MPPETSADAQVRRTAQAHRIELHQHDVADHGLGQVGVLAQRKATLSNTVQVGEQRAELEQHAQAAAQAVQLRAVARFDDLAVEHHPAAVGGVHAADQAHQRGLAAARPAQDGRDLAAREVQRDVGQDRAGWRRSRS